MKKYLLSIVLLCGVLLPVGAQRIYMANGPWPSFMEKQCKFKLTAYGYYSNGVERNRFYPQGANADESIVLLHSEMYHINTLDGDFKFDVRADGAYLYRSNKRKIVEETKEVISAEPDHSSWLKLEWYENGPDGMVLFTTCSDGIYRYFKYVGALSDRW